MTSSTRRAAALVSAALLLSGCGFRGAYSIDLPGGADVGDDPYSVQIQFADVLDLVPQSGVRVADVPVGKVTDVQLGDDWTAVVTVEVNRDVELPANAVAMIQQSSLLGEKYVELAAPGSEEPTGELGDGSLITLDRTNRNVEVEEVLGALSLVLNGGGLTQLQTITSELGQALEGRTDAVRNTLDQLDTFIGGLDVQREEINRALDSVNALAATLSAGTGTITTALDTIGPGLAVLEDQRGLLVSMLQSLGQLGDVGTRVINETGADTVANLQDLQPILSQLAAAGPNLAGSLDLLLTYPFPASSLTALQYRADQRTGGYALFTNMTADLNLDLRQLFCRYVVDQTTGALQLVDPEELTGGSCGQPGSPGNGQPTRQDGAAGTTSTTTAGPGFTLPTLPDLTALVPGAPATGGGSGLLGLPAIPGLTTGATP
ncbi:phospholipid/cholesterol/gamma-HCH transport system substrate-binding protein [Klenkia marina]|uniref:Phospholipid/cholesterol/gamma-HCH transport system substrate-binding protein n=1 Tax=Klenkia marina TaxID=1960309 RepID=A0A1G4Y0A4_9ACTN|nr:MCE family protein [Klenkia marina]SCX46852.1 phospholipid/cholesterol/gamma-HCH transport system substrate-binding protein [Klenkia marina]